MAPRPSSMYGTRPPSSLRLGGVVVPPRSFEFTPNFGYSSLGLPHLFPQLLDC